MNLKKLYKIDIINDYVINKKIVNFLNPEYTCVLMRNFENLSGIKNINKNKILESGNLNSVSSVSGEVSGIVNIHINGKNKKALFVKNNFKEKSLNINTKKIHNKEEFLERIKNSVFFKKFNKKEIKNIIVNEITDEPFIINEGYILKNLSDKIIDVVSLLNDLFDFDKSLIVFKNIDNDNISEYLSKSGSYTNMNIVALDDLFLLGREEYLLEKLGFNSFNTIVLKPSELLELRHFLKAGFYMSEKYISVVDTINKKTKIALVKKNIIVSELLNKFKLLSCENEYLKNGIISGMKIDENKEIISDDFSALFIVKKENMKQKSCINCGKCVSVCPVGINPKKRNKDGKIDARCIKCGLCNLMCPSDIDLLKEGEL